MDKQKFIALLDKHINQEALIKDLALELVIPWLEKKAAESSTNIDNVIVAALKELAMK